MAFCSDYKSSLTHYDLERYNLKINLCGRDPYELRIDECTEDIKDWPVITSFDIYDYFVLNLNFVSKEAMRCLKSLEAHTFFTSGHVLRPVYIHEVNSNMVLVVGKVKHSQSHSRPPLVAWLLVKKSGEIVCGHCTCMAGRGETCSHVAAICFAMEYVTKLRVNQACTDQLNAWLPPNLIDVPKRMVQDMDFRSSDTRWKKMPVTPDGIGSTGKRMPSLDVSEPSASAIAEFFCDVKDANPSAVVLSSLSDHCDPFIPPEMNDKLPKLMSSLYHPDFVTLSYEELVMKGREVMAELTVTTEQVEKVEKLTRLQRKSEWWGKFKQGRFGGSNMKLVCRGNISNPARSTLNSIVGGIRPHQNFSADCERGVVNEPRARAMYQEVMEISHDNFNVEECGFFLCKERVYLGVSPDGVVSCSCCEGIGGLEIKCPRSDNMMKSIGEDGNLIRDHAHSYQIQTAIIVCDFKYVDYFIYSVKVKDKGQEEVMPPVLLRILRDNDLVEEIKGMTEHYFLYCVLPELMAKYFSSNRLPLAPSNIDIDGQTTIICFCRTPRRDPVVQCADGKRCFSEYHIQCLGLTSVPSGRWKCPICLHKRGNTGGACKTTMNRGRP